MRAEDCAGLRREIERLQAEVANMLHADGYIAWMEEKVRRHPRGGQASHETLRQSR